MIQETVLTGLGMIRGVKQTGKYEGNVVFKKVPYAEPPIGKNRWKPPVSKKKWEGIYDSTEYASAPFQDFCDSAPWLKDFYFLPSPGISEDCLYLSITTGAENASERHPIYVWFHGGGLNNGYYFEPEFDGNELARKGIVVVSVGQRLNTFGYLSLPQLTKEQGKSGNYGFMDQIEAIRFIRENISAFGGDPENITVGGQSGGSLKCCALAGSPVSNKLIRRCIPQSGLKWLQKFQTQEEAEKAGKEFLAACGIDPDLPIEELRLLPPTAFRPKGGNESPMRLPGSMVYDGELVPFRTMKECFTKYASDIDFMCGTCLGESDVFAVPAFNASVKPFKTKEEFRAHFKMLLGDLYDEYDFDNLIPVTDENAWTTARILASKGLTKPGMVNYSRNLMVDRKFPRYMRQINPKFKGYAFLFSHFLPINNEDLGTEYDPEILMAYHSSDLFFSFASFRENVPPTRPWREEDYVLADRMSSYWANFMHSGNPNGDGLPYWQDASDGSYMDFTHTPEPHNGEDSRLDKLIEKFVSEQYDF